MNEFNKKSGVEQLMDVGKEIQEAKLCVRMKVNSSDKRVASVKFLLDFPTIKLLMPEAVYFKTGSTFLKKEIEGNGTWSYISHQTLELKANQEKYDINFFAEHRDDIKVDEIFASFLGTDTLSFKPVPLEIMNFEIVSVDGDNEYVVNLTDKITQSCKDRLILKEQEQIKDMLRSMLRSEECLEYCEAFMETFLSLVESDDDKRDTAGYHALNAILGDSYDDFLVASCGWTLKSILTKALLLKDAESEFHEEICNAVNLTEWDDGFLLEQPCKVNTKTFEVFEIEHDSDTLDTLENLQGEWVVIDGIKHPLFPEDEAQEKQYPVFWYGENE